jgi:hypothetical protein
MVELSPGGVSLGTSFMDEKALLHLLECPLRSKTLIGATQESVLQSAENTVRWLITEQVAGRAPNARETRDYFDQAGYFQPSDNVSSREYQQLVREGLRACRRLRDLICRCEVLQEVTPYTLVIADVRITGEYAVLRSSRRKKHAFVLYLRNQGIRIKPLIPDVVSFARWLDLANRWTALTNHHWGIESIGVMHYWVNRDLSAEHQPQRAFATKVLLGAASVIQAYPFPVPGEHCKSCPNRACRPDSIEPVDLEGNDRISPLRAPAAKQPVL